MTFDQTLSTINKDEMKGEEGRDSTVYAVDGMLAK